MLYRAGYKRIKAIYTPNINVKHRGKTLKEVDMIKNTFDHLIGMQLWEIGKQGHENYATVIESAKPDPKEFESVFNRLYWHLMHQSDQVFEALSENKDIFDEAFLAERLVNQTHDFCIKILISFGHEHYQKTLHYHDYLRKLESIGDRYFEIATIFHQNKESIDKKVLDYLEKTRDYLEKSASIYRKFNFEKIISLTNEISQTIKDYQEDIKHKELKNNLISCNIYPILLEIYEIIEILFFLNQDYFKDP